MEMVCAFDNTPKAGVAMYIAEIRIENFRCFGSGESRLILALKAGLTALVGENDTGKTAVIDALRFVLGTRDQEYFKVQERRFPLPTRIG